MASQTLLRSIRYTQPFGTCLCYKIGSLRTNSLPRQSAQPATLSPVLPSWCWICRHSSKAHCPRVAVTAGIDALLGAASGGLFGDSDDEEPGLDIGLDLTLGLGAGGGAGDVGGGAGAPRKPKAPSTSCRIVQCPCVCCCDGSPCTALVCRVALTISACERLPRSCHDPSSMPCVVLFVSCRPLRRQAPWTVQEEWQGEGR